MMCLFKETGQGKAKCSQCGRVAKVKHGIDRLFARCSAKGISLPVTVELPGDELKVLLIELGINEFGGCNCNSKAQLMNRWGIDGCRENFNTIRDWLTEAQAKASWFDKIKAAALAATSGIAMQIDLSDIAGSLVRLAIARAEKANKGQLPQ
jgi:hypothetical protein